MQIPTTVDVFLRRPSSSRSRCVVALVAATILPLTSCGGVPAETHDDRAVTDAATPTGVPGAVPTLAEAQAEIAKRTAAVLEVTERRRRWTRTLDELITVICEGEKANRHVAWVKSIRLEHHDGAPKMVAEGAVAGGDVRSVANLHKDLHAAPFSTHLAKSSPPSGVKRIDLGFNPAESIRYKWQWEFASPEVVAMPPSRPGGAGPGSVSYPVQLSEPEVRARYDELSEHLEHLPKAVDFSHFMQGAAKFAANAGISLDRFAPTRSTATHNGLTSVRCDLRFRGSLWQAIEFVSFVENHRRSFHVREFSLHADENATHGMPAEHKCHLVVESFVYEPSETLDAKFDGGGDTAVPGASPAGQAHQKRYGFTGRRDRRDVLVDPRPRR